MFLTLCLLGSVIPSDSVIPSEEGDTTTILQATLIPIIILLATPVIVW